MRVEVITHPSGDQLPILLDKDGLPIPTPNEFIIGRRALGTNTLVRNLRELTVFYRWLEQKQIDLGRAKLAKRVCPPFLTLTRTIISNYRRFYTQGGVYFLPS